MTRDLSNYTLQLMQYNENILRKFEETLQSEEETIDFYCEMKPFVDGLDELAEKWKAAAEAWIAKERPKYIHLNQVEQTYDNIKNNALQAFSKKTKEKRFKQTFQAVKYVLESIQEELKKESPF
jgi:hypothetical protein